jgi:NAD(P)-dependent dehydrogenase (short-subunit alcohol dehydrogenase family)
MGKLDGKVAIVTGAGQGIGRGVALALAKEGASVVLADIQQAACQQTAKEIAAIGASAVPVTCDVSRRDQVKAVVAAAVKEFGTVDILVNLAQAMRSDVLLKDTTDEDMALALGSGLMGTFYFMQECFPCLKEHGGKIINFGSTAGLDGASGWAAYAAAKESIRALTRVACHEWGRYRINVNAVCPLAKSPHWEKQSNEQPEMVRHVLAAVPMRRFGDCEKDIGRAVVFLASSDSDYITGQTLMVDGGQTMLR